MQQPNRVNLTGLGASTSASSSQSSNVTKTLLCVAAAATAVAGFAWYRRRTQSDGDDATAQMFDQPITVSGNPTGATVTASAPSSSAMATASGSAPRTASSNKGPQQRYHDAAAIFAAQTAPAALTSDECQSAIDAIVGLLPQYGGSVPRHLRPGYKSKKDKRKEKEEASKKERDGASKSAVVVKAEEDDEFETDSSDGGDSYTTQLSLEMDIADSMIENFQEELIELSGIAEQEQGYLATGTKPPAAFRSLIKREFGGATATLRWLEHSLEYFEIVKERNALAVRLAEDEAKMTVEELLARQDARIKRRQQMLDEEEGGQDGGREEADAVLDFGGKPDGRGIQYQSTPVTRAMQYGDLAEDDDDDDDAAEDGVLEMKSRGGAHASRKAVAAASGGRSQEQQEAMEDLLRMMGVDRRAMKNSRDGGYTVGGDGYRDNEDDDVEDWEDDEDDDFDEDAHMRMMMAGSGPYDEDRDYFGAGMYDGEDYGDDPNFYFREDDDDDDEEQDEDEREFLQAQFNEMLLKSVLMLHGRHFGKSSTTAAEEEEEESNASESSSENVNATKKDASSNKKKAGAGGKKQAKKTKSKKAATTKKSGKGAQQDEWVDY